MKNKKKTGGNVQWNATSVKVSDQLAAPRAAPTPLPPSRFSFGVAGTGWLAGRALSSFFFFPAGCATPTWCLCRRDSRRAVQARVESRGNDEHGSCLNRISYRKRKAIKMTRSEMCARALSLSLLLPFSPLLSSSLSFSFSFSFSAQDHLTPKTSQPVCREDHFDAHRWNGSWNNSQQQEKKY